MPVQGLTKDLQLFDQQLTDISKKMQTTEGQYRRVLDLLQSTDLPPTRQAVTAVDSLNQRFFGH